MPAGISAKDESGRPMRIHAPILQPLHTDHRRGQAAVDYKVIVCIVITCRELRSKNDAVDLLKPPGLGQDLGRNIPIASGNPWTLD